MADESPFRRIWDYTFLLNVAVYFRDARGVRWQRDAESGELEEIPPGEEIPSG